MYWNDACYSGWVPDYLININMRCIEIVISCPDTYDIYD